MHNKGSFLVIFLVLITFGISLPATAQAENSDTETNYVKKWANWANFHLEMMKETNYPYEKIDDELMKIYSPGTRAKYEDDEFEYASKKKKFLKKLKKKVKDSPKNVIHKIRNRVEFGDYNFEKNFYPVNPYSEGTYFPYDFNGAEIEKFSEGNERSFYVGGVTATSDYIPDSYKAILTNPDFIPDIHMEKSKAKKFLDSRKSQSGYVDREVVAEIHLVIQGFFKDPEKFSGDLSAEIIHTKIWDSEKTKNILAEKTKKGFEKYY